MDVALCYKWMRSDLILLGKKGGKPNISPFPVYTYVPKLSFVSFRPLFNFSVNPLIYVISHQTS